MRTEIRMVECLHPVDATVFLYWGDPETPVRAFAFAPGEWDAMLDRDVFLPDVHSRMETGPPPGVPDFDEPPVWVEVDCPRCGTRHVDRGAWAARPHRTHRCDTCRLDFEARPWKTVGV